MVALAPLLIMWFGLGMEPKIAIAALILVAVIIRYGFDYAYRARFQMSATAGSPCIGASSIRCTRTGTRPTRNT